jgi:hypothetical protein
MNNVLEELKNLNFPVRFFKNWILENLAMKEVDKETFKTLTQMLLALNEKVIHLPFKDNEKPILVQFQSNFNQEIDFYLAYENLGPIKGKIINENRETVLYLDVLFEKSFLFLKKELKKSDIISHMNIQKDIKPLYDTDKLILDIKG